MKRLFLLAVVGFVLTGSGCREEGGVPPDSGAPWTAFDPCRDVSRSITEKYQFDDLPRKYDTAAVVGRDSPGRGCEYSSRLGFRVLIIASKTSLAYADAEQPEKYQRIKVGEREAGVAGPQDSLVSVSNCRLLVEMKGGVLAFDLWDSTASTDPCATLLPVANDVVGLLPPGS